MVARRALFVVLSACFAAACGDDSGDGSRPDAGADASASGGTSGSGGASGTGGGASGTAGSAGVSGSSAAGGSAGMSAGGASGTAGAAGAAIDGGDVCNPPPGPPSQADCQGACQNAASAACPNDPSVAECTADCQEAANAFQAKCESLTVALVECEKTKTPSCTSAGTSSFDGCDSEYQQYLGCMACIPLPGDACSCCMTQYCCTERKSLFIDPSFLAFLDCRADCGFDPGCWNACDAQYATTSDKYYDFNFCVEAFCQADCF